MPASTGNEPVNLLSCDGGGIRGVSELVILDELMKTLQRKDDRATAPKPCEFFHLMGGTSTGGLVAIMLGRLEMSTEEALGAYDTFAREIFSKRRRSLIEKYRAAKLEQTIQQLVHARGRGDLLRDGRPRDARGRAFVCAMPEREHRKTVCLRTYDVPVTASTTTTTSSSSTADRDRHAGVRICEAARATTAATTYFRPMALRDDEGREHRLVDAALGTNNPASLCLREAAALFGTQRALGCVVSLGTGTRSVEMRAHGAGGLFGARFIASAIMLTKEIGTDAEREHVRMQEKFAGFGSTYYRFNVDDGAQGIALSDWKKIGELKERTRRYLQRPEVRQRMEHLADVLLRRRSNDGLMLAHGGGLSRENTIPAQPRFIRRGKSSNTFTGREEILERLDEYFGPRAPGHTSRRQFQLRGMGGVGKTQIALKFTERNDRSFKLVMWVDATDTVTIEESFRDIATNIFGPGEKKAAVQEVRRWLQQTDDEWLLVFDNAPASDLSQYLPDGDRGNVLYTTRHQNLQPRLPPGCTAPVEKMRGDEAVRLMLLSAQIPEDKTSSALARAIVEELGFLPLAIDQAGAYVHMAPCPLDQYLGVFRRQKEALLRSPKFRGGDEKRHIAVYACFNISYDAIKKCAERRGDMARVKDAELALKILRLICFYHNEGVLQNVFANAAQNRHVWDRHSHFPLRAGNVELEEFVSTVDVPIGPETPEGRKWLGENWAMGMALLHSYSLIQFDYSVGYSNMHILVHDWARNRMDETERREWGLAARCLLMDSLTSTSRYADVAHRRDAVPHLQVLLQHADIQHDDLALESEYQAKMARVYRQVNDLQTAEIALQRTLKLRKEAYGLLDRSTFTAMSQLASLYLDQGQYAQAADTALEVIDRRRLLHQESHWEATQGGVFHDQRSEEILDDDAARKDALVLLRALIRLDSRVGAENLLVDMIDWSERRHGSRSKETRIYQRLLTRLRDEIDSEIDADIRRQKIEDARQELEATTAEQGPDHAATIIAKRKLGRLLATQDACPEAYQLLGDVWEWNQHAYGLDSVQSVDAGYIVAKLLLKQCRPYEADVVFVSAVRTYEETLGKLHPKTLNAYQDMSLCHLTKADYRAAITAMRICAAGREAVLGPDHRLTRVSQACLANLLKSEEVLPPWIKAGMNNKAVETSKTILGPAAPQWMKDWKPVSEEKLMLEYAARGEPLYEYIMKEKKVEGVSFYDIDVIETKEPQTMRLTMRTEEVEVDHSGDSGYRVEHDQEILR